jgi:chromosome segregation ATPase
MSSQQLTLVWAAMLILGVASIAIHPFAPIAPMVFYVSVGLFLTRDQKNSDRFADSVYYLGFLLTLSALLLALHRLDRNADALSIAKDIGAGLSASIFGLGMRVGILQFRGTVTDQEEEARASIEEQAEKVRLVLQELEERWGDSSKVLQELASDLDRFKKELADMHKSALGGVERRQKALDAATEKMMAEWADQAERVRAKLADISIPPDIVEEPLRAMLGSVATHLKQSIDEATSAISTTASSFEKVTAAGEQYATKIAALSNDLEPVRQSLESLNSKLERTASSVVDASENAAAGLRAVASGASQLTAASGELVSNLSSVAPELERLRDTSVSAREAVGGVAQKVQLASESVASNVNSAKQDLEAVRKATKELLDVARDEMAKTA